MKNEWMDETAKGLDGWIEQMDANEIDNMDGLDEWNWKMDDFDGQIDGIDKWMGGWINWWKMYDVIYVWWMDGIETGWMDEGVELPERWFDQWMDL